MKKLPFKPTALRKHVAPSTAPDSSINGAATTGKEQGEQYDDGLDLFRRSKEMEPIVAADRERRLKKKLKRAEEEKLAEERARNEDQTQTSPREKRPREDPRDEDNVFAPDEEDYALGPFDADSPHSQPSKAGPSSDSQPAKEGSFTDLVTPPPSKRTRLGNGSSKAKSLSNTPNQDESPSTRRLRSSTKPAASSSGNTVGETLGSSSAPLILDDSDDEVKGEVLTPVKQRRQSGDSVQLVSEAAPAEASQDDEFEEYVRRAEEKRAKSQSLLNANSDAPARKVDILISSPIEGTRNCQITYHFDKALQRVRESWIALQTKHKVKLPDSSELILTWRQNKVYTYSNLLDLGIRPYGNFGIITDGDNSSGLRDNGTRVHMEMWTPELLEAHSREQQRRRRHAAGDISDEEEEIPEPEEDIKLKVNLKARDLDELGLTVRPETTVETLITAFRSQRGVPQEKEVSLRFDGDLLEEHATVFDVGIDDMDTIEVHIK